MAINLSCIHIQKITINNDDDDDDSTKMALSQRYLKLKCQFARLITRVNKKIISILKGNVSFEVQCICSRHVTTGSNN